MHKEIIIRFVNVGLRCLSLGSRFVLLFALARMLSPSDVGLYGLVMATISFSVLVIGGDYYTYSQRELISRPREEWGFVLQHQVIALALLYTTLLPLQWLVFGFNLLPVSVLFWFFAVLIVEHLAQELSRLLVAMQKQFTASFVLFVRCGLWVWVMVPLMWFFPVFQSLETVFMAWFIGSLSSVLLGVAIVWRNIPDLKWWKVDWAWLCTGFRRGLMFLVATMSFKFLLTADRFVIEYFAGADVLGVYVLYMGMAMVIVRFLDPAIFSFLYPRLVRAWQQGNYVAYRRILRELSISTILVSIGLAGTCAVLAPWVLLWTGKDIYLEQQSLLWILLIMVIVYAVGMIPHYGLYARGADRSIMLTHLSSPVIFAVLVALTVGAWPIYAVPSALIGTFVWVGGVKMLVYMRLEDYSCEFEGIPNAPERVQ